MSNRLLTKIKTYSVGNGHDFNEPFTGAGPTQYGAYENSPSWSVTNVNDGLTSINNDGPFPGQYCWNFEGNATTGKQARLSVSANTAGSGVIYDQSFTYSIWVRFNHPITGSTTNPNYLREICECQNNASQTGGDPNWSGWWFGYRRDSNSASPTFNQVGFNMYSAPHDKYFYLDGNGNTFNVGEWYLLSIRKTTDLNNNTVEFYINGQLMFTGTQAYIPSTITNFAYGYGGTYFGNFSLGPDFMGDSAVFTQSVLQTIYNYGSPIQVPVKYYDGSAWQTSSNQKVYDGSKWIPMYANRWTGTEWVPI